MNAREWTNKELATLRNLNGEHVRHIAEILNRTPRDVTEEAKRLKVQVIPDPFIDSLECLQVQEQADALIQKVQEYALKHHWSLPRTELITELLRPEGLVLCPRCGSHYVLESNNHGSKYGVCAVCVNRASRDAHEYQLAILKANRERNTALKRLSRERRAQKGL